MLSLMSVSALPNNSGEFFSPFASARLRPEPPAAKKGTGQKGDGGECRVVKPCDQSDQSGAKDAQGDAGINYHATRPELRGTMLKKQQHDGVDIHSLTAHRITNKSRNW